MSLQKYQLIQLIFFNVFLWEHALGAETWYAGAAAFAGMYLVAIPWFIWAVKEDIL